MPVHTYTNWNSRPSDREEQVEPYPSLDTPFEESMGIGYSKIDREIPIELNKEIPICVKIGTSSNRMEVLDITEDFRKIECDAGIAVTITVCFYSSTLLQWR